MIKNFRHKGLAKFFLDEDMSGIKPVHARRLRLILALLNTATKIQDLNFPGSHLHSLKGSFKGYWSVTVSGNWRVIFQFLDGDAFNVDYLDYH